MELKDLAEFGFNISEGLELCADDEEIYTEVLEAALEEGLEKLDFIEDLYQKDDRERYVIEVHGLKNAAKQIGADNLSEMAKFSELTGKAGDFETVRKKHPELMAEYKRIVEALQKFFA